MSSPDRIKEAIDREVLVVSDLDAAKLGRVKRALLDLQEAGIQVVVVPNAIVVRAGRIEMTADGDGRAISANRVKITINGNEIQNMLSFAQVTAEVDSVIRFEVKFGGLA